MAPQRGRISKLVVERVKADANLATMKHFDTNKLTKAELRLCIKVFAKSMSVRRVAYNNKAKHLLGSYNPLNQTIFIDVKQCKQDMLLTFFHELAHHIAVSKSRWLLYHYDSSTPLISASKKFVIENKIDKLACKLWRKNVDIRCWGKYKYGYKAANKKKMIARLDGQHRK